ncbi:hypothetical protein L249_3884 [Ophiocordyceps polyrhachis-furcata BCC 54312]|uniref:Uncharacterized protein n=1 Tax=Ophiocordyceps polyrhachis-furcata BCC 54312 TaxID=1330021 RepID=A0A367L5E9_9HYPO|nr:hypothetical protein L249_3884 [Ophiocordyceps polyrhachis-furcata BCC 54312]
MLIEIMDSSSSAAKQPTYTTAGTIYNPNTALPLQPPARRARANRFQPGSSHSDLPLFHRPMLAPGQFSCSPRVDSSSKLPLQYTPLQQNYDRAVSPINDSDHAALNMALCLPHPLPEKAPAPLCFLLADKDDGDKAKDDEQQPVTTAEDDKQDQLRMQSLKKMPIKSVNNLASYPNPTQRAARMALREGGGGGGGAAGGGAGGPSFVPGQDTPMGLLRPADAMNTDHAGPPPRLLPTARDADGSTPMTLANGPGAPMPLTAGPPGQRQYRPSTFESTFRALQPRGSQPVSREETGASYDTLADLVAASDPDPEPYRCFPPRGSVGAWAQIRQNTAASSADGGGAKARGERIEEAWYAGTKYLGMTMEEILVESASRRSQYSYGAIGDGRPKRTKTEYAHIDMEKARSTPVTEDAATLLRCVFGSLVRHEDDRAMGSPFAQWYGRQPDEESKATTTDPTGEDDDEDDDDDDDDDDE